MANASELSLTARYVESSELMFNQDDDDEHGLEKGQKGWLLPVTN
jgi:hypothetical protein